ncbi:MAG: hypothetical protein KTR16_14070 [Acidiferrobacterales bacterium]|nr:hypothetical protein [Acidiferrobacterales bacterium]
MITSARILIRGMFLCGLIFSSNVVLAQQGGAPRAPAILPDSDNMLLTVFLKHDQTMNNRQRRDILQESGFRNSFPPEGVEIVDHYVMMGIGQVIVMRFPPELLRIVNRVFEHTAWGAYQTEFYVTYDLAEASRAQTAAQQILDNQ